MAISIRTMTDRDVQLGMTLASRAGWNQTAADWFRLLAMEPAGCFVAEWEGRPAGTAVTTVLGAVGWIAMVLVDEAVRGRGIGTRLVEHALTHLRRRSIPTVRLDATALGRPLYEKLGFVPEYEMARWEGDAPAETTESSFFRAGPLAAHQLPAVAELDRHITGTDRQRLLKGIYELLGGAWAVTGEGKLAGYGMLRPGARAIQVGPAVALDPESGTAIFAAALQACAGHLVFIDIPVQNAVASRWAEANGLQVQRRLLRMRHGQPVHDCPAQLWASSGPENG
jgi:GNAT superfamily N-acetyltransferase